MNGNNNFETTLSKIKKNAVKYPNKIAIKCDDETITYNNLVEKINMTSFYLIERELNIQDSVLICMNRSIECMISILAVLNIGCIYIPVDPAYSLTRISHIIKDINPKLIITTSDFENGIAFENQNLCLFDKINFLQYVGQSSERLVLSMYIMYIIYTSGSTGNPKGVVVHHEGVENLLNQVRKIWPLNEIVLQFASLGFDASIPEWAGCLSMGGTLIIVKDRKLVLGTQLIQLINKHGINFIKMPAAVLSTIEQEDKIFSLKTVVTAGDACNLNLVKKWGSGRDFYNCYGPTENSIGSIKALCSVNDVEIVIGKPWDGVTVYILDEDLNPLQKGEIGEIYLGGIGLAYGYYNRPDMTAERFIPNPFEGNGSRIYKTGDLGMFKENGNISFQGRTDTQVKINGFRIEIEEIVITLKNIRTIKEAAVVPVYNENDQYLVGFFKSTDISLDEKTIKSILSVSLPPYMIPERLYRMEEFILTVNGKVDIAYLENYYHEELSKSQIGQNNINTGKTEIDSTIINIWKLILKQDQLKNNSNFFEMGGGSMDAAKLIANIEVELGVAPSIGDLYENPNLLEFTELTKKMVKSFL